ncbi:hypothetical protein [Myxococcus virescens]|uniref:Lipoprotein n=1 Tax=Myxococcus virescens TaxID=83456 RepID=A0A511HT60_9BACT|nr:hypothetical protein [Myxococcus virescens]GEL75719.1 hypothetical protein MVI01_75030 [Myxococcus virescens]SDD65424.1 hypothetical protein SAMN04488504_102140 [Myxococcus virescens]
MVRHILAVAAALPLFAACGRDDTTDVAGSVVSATQKLESVQALASCSDKADVEFTQDSPALLDLGTFDVVPGQEYAASLNYYQQAAARGFAGARLEVRWFDASGTEIFPSALLMEGAAVNTHSTLTGRKVAPETATTARLLVGRTAATPHVRIACAAFLAPLTPRP